MQPDSSHYLAALIIVIVFGFGIDRIFWKSRRHSLTWQMHGLQVAWIAGIFVSSAIVLYGFNFPVILEGV